MTLEDNTYLTYKFLDKDIKLKKDPISMKWDRIIENGDFKVVEGPASLNSGCIISIMTKKNELFFLPTYIGFGNKTWFLLKDLMTEMNLFKAQEYTTEVLKDDIDIKEVLDVTVSPNPFDIDIYWTVITHADQTINGGVNSVGSID